MQAMGMITHGLDLTTLISLLQPPPEVRGGPRPLECRPAAGGPGAVDAAG
jgi:hypothetical protein